MTGFVEVTLLVGMKQGMSWAEPPPATETVRIRPRPELGPSVVTDSSATLPRPQSLFGRGQN